MVEEYTQIANEFFSQTIADWSLKGSSLLADSLTWLSQNQNYLFCVAGGIAVGIIYAKFRKKS